VQKLRFLYILLLLPSLLFAQQKSRIELIGSKHVNIDMKTNISYVRNPIFKHDNAILTCDSAVFYSNLNYFEAFKNVHINQADTMNIYSDLLNYNGNTKMAHLINNVRMIDRTSVLTTNILDYDMGLKIGKYLEGGKIVNTARDVTITSKRGWYFANNNDAWFKRDVYIVTPQVKITSDSVKFNTVSNWADFHGITNIKGKDDNLYTENGRYNTKTEDAFFGKNNLYTQGTKSLKGDSLFYNGKQGYGKAIRNIVFKDTEDNLNLFGQLGEYYKEGEKVIVTDRAYFAIGTSDSVTVNDIKKPDSAWIGADTLLAQMVLQKSLKLISTPIVLKNNEIGAETAEERKEKAARDAAKNTAATAPNPNATAIAPSKESTNTTPKKEEAKKPPLQLDPKNKLDSLAKQPDSSLIKLTTPIPVKKIPDSTVTSKPKDTTANTKKNKAADTKAVDKATAQTDLAIKPIIQKDTTVKNPADTLRTRTIKAYNNVRIYKSNLQAKADSLFYSAADSTLRWFKDPIIWSENSQQTGDTIYVQFKQKKINNFQVLSNGFMVNTEGDSTKFNQVKGLVMTGFFKDGELKTMYVDGNAESIYFTKQKENNKEVDKMNQTVSARLKFDFKGKEIASMMAIKDIEGAYFSDQDIPTDPHLTGFTWKPELRPKGKEDIIKGIEKPKVEKAKATPSPKTTPIKNNTPSKAKTTPPKNEKDNKTTVPNKTVSPTAKPTTLPQLTDSVKKETVKKDSLRKQN
jgi:lipopolysaccharide export system protein LptA